MGMGAWSLMRSLTGDQRKTFMASFLGWSLDAFDYFLVTFVILRIAKDFNVGLSAVLLTVTLTLMMRPVGALIFGILADRFGRRIPLMVDIMAFSVLELLTAFSPNCTSSSCSCASSSALLWEESGDWDHPWPWNCCRPSPEGSSLVSYNKLVNAFGYLLAALVYGILFTAFPTMSGVFCSLSVSCLHCS